MRNRYKVLAVTIIIMIFSSISIYSTIRIEKKQQERIMQERRKEELAQDLKEEAALKKEEIMAREKVRVKAWKEAKARAEAEAKARAEAEARARAAAAKAKAEAEARAKAAAAVRARIKAEAALHEVSEYGKGLAAYMRKVNYSLSEDLALAMARYFICYGDKYGIDPNIIVSIAQGESTFYPDAVSKSGEHKGLMQTSDDLARASGYEPDDVFDPEVSIMIGTKHLRAMIDMFGDLKLGITARAYGSGAVKAGKYKLEYAEKVLERAEAIENYLIAKGYFAIEGE